MGEALRIGGVSIVIVVGIDEAGYGPLLGPLVVTATVFEVPDGLQNEDLWNLLREAICRDPSRHETRLPIADSKKLYDRKKGLITLERTALVMLNTANRSPHTLRDLLHVLSPGMLAELQNHPWYAAYECDIPTASSALDISTRANAVKRCMSASQVSLRGIFSEVLLESDYNRRIQITRNKAAVLMQAALRLVQRVRDRFGPCVIVHVDRHGGRSRYREALMTFFECKPLRIISETATHSAYTVGGSDDTWTIDFTTKGETSHLPIALASIFSKYLRELLMGAINAYFAERIAGLVPTAGYYTDAKRFLADIAQVVQAENIGQSTLVRSR
ncbi:MAG: hypothetical protein GXP29_15075 [Planctomycetes bacterium]|nr:hypothetical protein [Planctomycetota bacterium]